MDRTAVLTALKNIIDDTYTRTYIYPDNYASMDNAPTVPFVVIEEQAATPITTATVGAGCYTDNWTIAIYGFVYAGETEPPGTSDATAKAAAYTARDNILAALKSNDTIQGTIIGYGSEQTPGIMHMIVPMQWNGRPYFGVYFEVSVLED